MGRIKYPTGPNPVVSFVAGKVTADSAKILDVSMQEALGSFGNSLLGLKWLYLAIWAYLPQYGARNGVASTPKSSLRRQGPALPQFLK